MTTWLTNPVPWLILLVSLTCGSPSGSATVAAQPAQKDQEDDEDRPQPGLFAEYRTLAGTKETIPLYRIDLKPAFTWGRSSPHPRLPAGPFEVSWTGLFMLREAQPVRFGAYVGGEVTVSIDGKVVLRGRGGNESTWIEAKETFTHKPGLYPLRIHYRSLPHTPARLQIWWEGQSFAREPVPGIRLKHFGKDLPQGMRKAEQEAHGREAAGRLGCARCHQGAFPGIDMPSPGPALVGLGQRVSKSWLLEWLANPAKVRAAARMPALFTADRQGFIERWLITEYLGKTTDKTLSAPPDKTGDHRLGRQMFMGLGCFACHHEPDKKGTSSLDPDRHPLDNLGHRMTPAYLAAFLQEPAKRYPDGRMPKLPMDPATAHNIATFLLMWSKPAGLASEPANAPKEEEIQPVLRRLHAKDQETAAKALLHEKGCVRCHTGLDEGQPGNIPIRQGTDTAGCLGGTKLPRFALDDRTRQGLVAYAQVAPLERHDAPFAKRQQLLRQLRCHRCHQREEERAAPLEEIGRTSWASHLVRLPSQRPPRLTQATSKFTRDYLLNTIRHGVSGVRPAWFSYRMPSFGDHAETILQALAESDGDLIPHQEKAVVSTDPTLTAMGPNLVGFEGYSCVSCHVWNGKELGIVEPGTVGPELTSLTQRIRHDWFQRFLDDPARVLANTPMPAIFRHGEPAPLQAILNGNAHRQKEAMWAYLALGKNAPHPKPRPPMPLSPPRDDPPVVAQIPVQLPDGQTVESICVWNHHNDLLVYDVHQGGLRNFYLGAQLLRQANTWRSYQLTGTPLFPSLIPLEDKQSVYRLAGPGKGERPSAITLLHIEPLHRGMRIRSRLSFAAGTVALEEIYHLEEKDQRRWLVRGYNIADIPDRYHLEMHMPLPSKEKQGKSLAEMEISSPPGRVVKEMRDGLQIVRFLTQPGSGVAAGILRHPLPPPQQPDAPSPLPLSQGERGTFTKPDDGPIGPRERPGFRAILYPRPKTPTGEDLLMPSALAVDPRNGRLFIASMKLGDLYVLDDPHDNGQKARFSPYAQSLFQDVFGMVHDGQDLYVAHRRNLTRLREVNGRLQRFERVAPLIHGVGNAYDWAYGLIREPAGSFLLTFAPHANHKQAGAGSLLRLTPSHDGIKQEEIAFGFRNPLGWCVGPDNQVFFTDNQGEWVATNKLCHIVEGRFYGYPNPAQAQHAKKPMGHTTIWVPYEWARSINGVTYEHTGKFGPFAGQIFMAELMNGGAIIRANLEKVNGVYQGACFPFWDKPLLGPLVLTFDPKGRLFVGALTTPGWLSQPDRGALFRIDFTGQTPFEIQSIHVRPQGFRLLFTRAVADKTARDLASYQVEHYRYEYTGAYGSPELDRTRVPIQRIDLHTDGRTVDLTLPPLEKNRVYRITAAGVRSAQGERLVHPSGAYTLNEVPKP